MQQNSERSVEAMFFAAYVGSSMHPTLREPEIMEILPYKNNCPRVGDVAFFLSPESGQPIVHRVIRIAPEGISTIGDNNLKEDAFLLQPEHIQGRVAAARRGRRTRKIAGGLCGRLTGRLVRGLNILFHGASPVLHPVYKAFYHWGIIARMLPAGLRPRVVVFRVQGCDQFQLMLGRRIVGHYDEIRQKWQIRRPFHLLVNGKALPVRQDRERMNRPLLTERRQAMSPLLEKGVQYELILADGHRWRIAAGDEGAASIVKQLGGIMQLRMAEGASERSGNGALSQLLVQVDVSSSLAECYVPLAQKKDGVVVCILSSGDNRDGPFFNLVRLSLVMAREAQARGAVLIHGALAERDGMGVILAAPGGTGKTTASNRFPAPWRSLCDDTTLVVRDPQGGYWAHPWPTWSRFAEGGPGGTWDVQRAVPLKGIFFLDQAIEDRTELVGPGHAVSLLVECVRQASQFMPLGLFKEEVHALYLERFDNLCALARVVPAHVLKISLTGNFWLNIEQALASEGREETIRKKESAIFLKSAEADLVS